jgi:hypothetical protein
MVDGFLAKETMDEETVLRASPILLSFLILRINDCACEQGNFRVE